MYNISFLIWEQFWFNQILSTNSTWFNHKENILSSKNAVLILRTFSTQIRTSEFSLCGGIKTNLKNHNLPKANSDFRQGNSSSSSFCLPEIWFWLWVIKNCTPTMSKGNKHKVCYVMLRRRSPATPSNSGTRIRTHMGIGRYTEKTI